MAILDDILGNAEFPDDMKLNIGNHEVPLGELRSRNSQIAERDSRLQELSAERDRFRSQYDELSGTMTRLLGQADKAASAAVNEPSPKSSADLLREALGPILQGADPAEPLFQDKVFGAFANRLESKIGERYDSQLQKLTDSFTALQDLVNNGFQAVTAAQVGERERRWYDINRSSLPKDKDGKPVALDSIKQFAAQRGIYQVNSQGQITNLLDLDRTLEVLTEPTRQREAIDAAAKAAYERGIQEGRTAAGKVIPFMGDRSAGAAPADQYSTKGKSPRQIIADRMKQGLADLSAEGLLEQ